MCENITVVTVFLRRGGEERGGEGRGGVVVDSTDIGCNGNLLLSKMAGSNIIVIVPNI